MKNLSFLTLFVFVAFSAFAQEITVKESSTESTPSEAFEGKKADKPHMEQGTAAAKATLDTLTDVFDRSTGFRVYINAQQHPITGSNNVYGFVGTRYNFSGYAEVTGVLIGYANYFRAAQTDNYSVHIFSTNTNGLPAGQSRLGATFSGNQIMTDTSGLVWTHIPFTNYVGAQSNFAVMVQTRPIQSVTDSIDYVSIYSNNHGNGNGEQRAVAIKLPNLTGVKIANEYNVGGAPIDIDLMVLPILSIAATGIDAKLEGLTFKGVSPNPAKANATLNFSLDNAEDVTIMLLDMNGRIVKEVANHRMQAGSHTVNIDVTDLKSGMYFYTIVAGKAKMASKLIVD